MKTKRTKHTSRRFRRFWRANEAVSALEYAILVGVIALGMGGALVAFEGRIDAALTTIGTSIGNITQGTPVTS